MAKEVTGIIKLQIRGGVANPAPPIGPALGAKGVNIMEFCKQFNARTQDKPGKIIPVVITVYIDKSFDFIIKTAPAASQLLEAAKQKKGSGEPKMAHSEEFHGDMSRNEVEIDLNKFMSMVTEIGDLKAKIMEMEMAKEPDNPWQRWIWFSNMIDAYRIFPRAFLSVYIYLLYFCTMWFMALEAPTFEQSGLISIVVGAGAAWFGLYVGSGHKKGK